MTDKTPLIIEFLRGVGEDAAGRKIEDYLKFTPQEMEEIHDYIQWVFPTETRSMFNKKAPILNRHIIHAINSLPGAMANYLRFLDKMLVFYMLNKHWLVEKDHNHLRITRIIESVSLIAGERMAAHVYKTLMRLIVNAGHPVDDRAITIWQDKYHEINGVYPPMFIQEDRWQ